VSNLTIKHLSVAHIGPVDLELNPGEMVCLSGASGSGKSLLLRAIADIIPASGEITLDQHSHTSMPAPQWRRQVSLLPAESQWWHDRVGEHFSEVQHLDLEGFTQLGFKKDCLDWSVSRCSTGERQRLALLRLLAIKPKCLLLDEPTGSLDPANTRRVESMIVDLAQRQSVPVLWVSHSHEQIERIADRHFVMQDGTLVAA